MKKIVILHNIRSAYNVGAIFRTADGLGFDFIYLTGYTPAPFDGKSLLMTKAQKKIAKTALGAEKCLKWKKIKSINLVIDNLKRDGFLIAGVEQSKNSQNLVDFSTKIDIALVMGNEVRGIDKRTLKKCDHVLEIPMLGKKNSFNVEVAFAIAGYQICCKIEKED